MERSTVIGLILGIVAVGIGMVLKGASLAALWNPAAYLIIFVGTAASLFIGFPMNEIKKFPILLKMVFTQQQIPSKPWIIQSFVDWGFLTRREGLLTLENKLETIEDDFIKEGLQLIIDGAEPDSVKKVMNGSIHAMEERHRAGALLFTQAGTYAPTLGVLGAVVGLIAALSNLNDVEKLGHSIAAAFIATLLGIFSGYVLWHPIANKLKRLSKNEVEIKEMIIDGVLAIQSGTSPTLIEQNLMVYLSTEERKAFNSAKGGER